MKFFATFAALPLLLLSACSAPPAPPAPPAPSAPSAPATQAQQGHEQHAPAAAGAQDSPAQRYATDAPLRKGMAEVRVAVDGLGAYENGHLSAAQAIPLATTIQEQIDYMVANCKLEPQADAALHGIIAKLGAGAQALKTDPTDLTAIPPMREAVADYPRIFDDPAFATPAQ